tara:strand:+ start:136 stop:759 length:624 start_codon:yes stop_codon:yes gene_type:complete
MIHFIPLFPLNVVLFPGMSLPLHIFEERYKELIGECLRTKSSFGVLYSHGKTTERIGCTAKVLKIIKKYDDGKIDLFTLGDQRFKIVHFDTEASYLRGWSNPYSDNDSVSPPDKDEVNHLLELYREISYLLNKKKSEVILGSSNSESLSFHIASDPYLPKKIKQQVLESRSEKHRVEILTSYFIKRLPFLHQMEVGAKKAGSNGNIR